MTRKDLYRVVTHNRVGPETRPKSPPQGTAGRQPSPRKSHDRGVIAMRVIQGGKRCIRQCWALPPRCWSQQHLRRSQVIAGGTAMAVAGTVVAGTVVAGTAAVGMAAGTGTIMEAGSVRASDSDLDLACWVVHCWHPRRFTTLHHPFTIHRRPITRRHQRIIRRLPTTLPRTTTDPTLAIARTIYMVSRQHLIRITAGHRTTPSLVINKGRQRAVKGRDIRHAGMAETAREAGRSMTLKLARAEMPAEALQIESYAAA